MLRRWILSGRSSGGDRRSRDAGFPIDEPHGPDREAREGDLRLDLPETARESGVLEAGEDGVAELLARIHADGRIEYRTDPQWFTPYMRRESVEWQNPEAALDMSA